MKRLGLIATLAVLTLLIGFYVVWPAWSVYGIRNALQSKNPDALAAKIDFRSLEDSLRPAVTQKVADGFDRYQAQLGGAGGLLVGQFKASAVPKIAEASLKTLMTPEMMIRIASEAGPIKETIERILREQIGRGTPSAQSQVDGGDVQQLPRGLGGLLGRVIKGKSADPGEVAPEAANDKPAAPRFSLSNIKGFGFNGPLSFQVGLAKDPAASEADVTAEMSFTGGDWKLTGLRPRL
jgi:Protein of unknown function (DUF2939)